MFSYTDVMVTTLHEADKRTPILIKCSFCITAVACVHTLGAYGLSHFTGSFTAKVWKPQIQSVSQQEPTADKAGCLGLGNITHTARPGQRPALHRPPHPQGLLSHLVLHCPVVTVGRQLKSSVFGGQNQVRSFSLKGSLFACSLRF